MFEMNEAMLQIKESSLSEIRRLLGEIKKPMVPYCADQTEMADMAVKVCKAAAIQIDKLLPTSVRETES